MTVFTCNDDFVSMMTCIYDAWDSKLGHDNIKLKTEPILEPELFCDYKHIEADEEKSEKVVRTVRNKLSDVGYVWVYYAVCSDYEDKLDLIYRFMVKGFKIGPGIVRMLQDPVVIKMMEIRRRVTNEEHLFREFLRFTSIDGKVYVAHLSPKSDVVAMVAEHFADRMPSEYWIIIDDNRSIAAVHPVNSSFYLRMLTPEEMNRLGQTEAEQKDLFTGLWKNYFDSIAIKERENYVCQRGHFPIWMRKHVTEFLNE